MAALLTADLCVVGGGMAGVCAALAAARLGARVVLVQDRSVLGGNASSEIRMHIVGASCSGRRPLARESGLLEEIRLEEAVRNPLRSPAIFDLLLYDLVAREPNITLLLDTACDGCVMDGRRIAAVEAVRQSTEERFRIEAPFYADCSGDSRLGKEARADFRMGREARAEFGEPHAPEQADASTLGSTILLMARDCGRPAPFIAPPWARRVSAEDLKLRSHRDLDYGYWWAEWGGHLDTIRDNPRIRHELLAIELGVWDHIKNHCRCGEDPSGAYEKRLAGETPPRRDAENWALEWVGMLPGKRESRRLLGPVILTEHDIAGGRLFEDTVAYGGWWMDLHPVAGVDAKDEAPCEQVEVPHLYSIPLRALYSRNVENLFMAGRNISATHVAFSSTRVMGACSVAGQAVGTAAALAARQGLCTAAGLLDARRLRELQQTLLKMDAFLPGIRAADPADIAPQAVFQASSQTPGGEAWLAVNGITRRLTPALHPTFEESSNQWRPESLPAWIELEWERPRVIREVHLTFDTGFERELTLSMSEAFTRRMIRGPQPETARAYTLSAPGGELRVDGNYQRKRVHGLERAITTDRLRLTVEASNGAPAAGVFEIRVYEEVDGR
jgi:hypothetical protein